jgi:hypothetical protein
MTENMSGNIKNKFYQTFSDIHNSLYIYIYSYSLYIYSYILPRKKLGSNELAYLGPVIVKICNSKWEVFEQVLFL